MDDASALTAIISALAAVVGAAAALGGVLITQRSERRKAHADRVWSDRVGVYRTVYEWAEEKNRLLSDRLQPNPGTPTPDVISALRSGLPTRDSTKLRLFGSTEVVKAQGNAHGALGRVADRLQAEQTRGQDQSSTGKTAISEALDALRHLEEALIKETSSGD